MDQAAHSLQRRALPRPRDARRGRWPEEKGAQDAEKKIKQKYKKDTLRAQNIEKENKKLKEKLEEDKKKAADAAQALEFERGEKKLKLQEQKHQDEKQKWKIEKERYIKDTENIKRRAEQGLTADQGTAGEITMGNFLEKIFFIILYYRLFRIIFLYQIRWLIFI